MKVKLLPLVAGLAFLEKARAQSSLYPAVDSVLLAQAFNVSLGCLEALNQTVSCDGDLLRMAGTVDNYLWDITNVTALCTSGCLSTTSTWFTNVMGACSNDYMNVNGRFVPPYTVPGRILDGMNIACLTPNTDVSVLPGVNGTEITSTTTIISNSTVPVDTTVPSGTPVVAAKRANNLADLASAELGSDHHHIMRQTSGSSGSGYCLIDSYSWVGSDIIRPDCTDTSTDPQCLDPTDVPDENQRIANLYPDSVLCSPCFLKMFYLRVASPYLPVLDYSDYLLEQYLDIVDVCKANMPELLVRMEPGYDYVNGTWDGLPEYNSSTSSATVVCSQTLQMADLQSLTVPNPTANGSIYCDAISTKYGVTTGDLQLAFDAPFCTPDETFSSVCLPPKCTVEQIPFNTTCDSVVASIGSNVTVTQFLAWNPNLVGLCDELPSQYVCAGAPGGSYIPPAVHNATSSDAGQSRGGGTGDSTGDGSTIGGGRNATVVALGGTPPSPVQSGISPQCTEYAKASANDGCVSFPKLWAIPQAKFFAWNPILGANGENCLLGMWAGTYYCIDVARTSTTAAVAPSQTSAATAPGPTQSGIISTCNKYAIHPSDVGCDDFAKSQGITSAQLYAWNPILGEKGENCNTNLWAKEYYCVGVSDSSAAQPTTTTTTTTAVAATTPATAPGPTQSGIISTCNKYAVHPSGVGCDDFAKSQGITSAQLYAWNLALGTNGANCNTSLWEGEYYCVGVLPPPGSVQSGIIDSCNKYAIHPSGVGCDDFAKSQGITSANLYLWNTVLGANGANCNSQLWVDEYYCVGVNA